MDKFELILVICSQFLEHRTKLVYRLNMHIVLEKETGSFRKQMNMLALNADT